MIFPRQFIVFSVALLFLITNHLKADTLLDALNLAYSGNPSLEAARSQLKSVDKSIALAWAGALPQVSASGSYNRQRTETKIESEITSGALVAGGVNKRTSSLIKTGTLTLTTSNTPVTITGVEGLVNTAANKSSHPIILVSTTNSVLSSSRVTVSRGTNQFTLTLQDNGDDIGLRYYVLRF